MTSVNDPLPLHPHLWFLFEKMMELLEVEQKMGVGGGEGEQKHTLYPFSWMQPNVLHKQY